MRTTFQQFLQTAFVNGPWATDEIIAFVLPLFEEVLSFHEAGQVAPFEDGDTVFLTDNRLDINEAFTHTPKQNVKAVTEVIEKLNLQGLTITDRILIDDDVSQNRMAVYNMQVEPNPSAQIIHPVFLPGYTCFEIKLGHHDAQTDIFCLGLILGSVVMGLDLYDVEDLQQFAAYRTQPAGLNARVHPTICALVTEMTEFNRHQRSRDLYEVIQRLRNYRDYDPQRSADLSELAIVQEKKPADRNSYIISKLRNRLFDTTRRNRLLYYKPNSRFVNLTVSSVPMVLYYQSIRPELLFTWNSEVSKQIIGMKDLPLNKYLRFEDHPYLDAQLNSIRQDAEKDIKEYGFCQLKLVVAFLHWHNLKEDANERIQSPLLLLPVELKKIKGLKEEKFVLKIIDNAALVNPVLSNYLKDLYGIKLPEQIDFDDVSMEGFHQLLKAQIDAAKQGVVLNYIDKPRIKLIHNIARQTINNYKKKLRRTTSSFRHVDYSYAEDDYRPLGLQLFKQKVQPQQSNLEFLLSETTPASQNFFTEEGTSQKTTFHLTDGENNPYSWDFDVCNMVLGNFNYKKMSLVGDYNSVAEKGVSHPVFNQLFSTSPKAESKTAAADLDDWHHVIAADPTQTKAILYNRSGESYVIQGPPGTGKSQTITNLIADFLAQGKNILFVCEKRAALDVVYHRLQQNHLAELCCYIHDSQGDKKAFVQNLKATYEDFIKVKMDLDAVQRQRSETIRALKEQIALLQEFHQHHTTINDEAGISTRSLIEKLVALSSQMPSLKEEEKNIIPSYKHWQEAGQIIQALSKALEESGAEPHLAHHPFRHLNSKVVEADSPLTLLDSLVKHAQTAITHITQIISQNKIPAHHSSHLTQIKNLVQDAVILQPLAQSGNLQLVNEGTAASKQFEDTYRQYKSLEKAAKEATEKTGAWKQKFSESEVAQALPIAAKHEGSFFAFLNGGWRRLTKSLQQSYDFSSHQLKPSYHSILQALQEEYKSTKAAQSALDDLQQRYRVDNINTVYVGIDALRRKRGDAEIDYLLAHPQANDLVIELSKLNNSLHQLELQLQQCLYQYDEKSIAQIKDELSTIGSNADVLKELLPVLKRFASLPSDVQTALRKIPLTPVQTEAAMAHKTLQDIYASHTSFARTGSETVADAVKSIEEKYKRLLQLNSDYIRALRRQQFLQRYELSNASTTGLTAEQKALKKSYTEGRRILEHEMSKTMRYKSIREMASGESGLVLKDVKPVWLMSPLSVSDSLPIDAQFFDVVIFDEASQITLEEGVPALFRAPQSIIVGDDKQMPPTNFFNAKTEDPDDLESFDGENEDEILSTEADSLLVQGARKLSSTMLSWHYRSRYETLISYSNHAFYDAGLLTIPDQSIHYNNRPGIEVAKPEEGADTAAYLLNTSISFHYLPNSVYEARSNKSEASYIAYMVRRLLLDDAEETIGIVAFSQEQQGIIEEAIAALAATDKAFEEALEKAYNREDDGQFTGLFIKNLENVQGDERDIIIMSVCYGHDASKKMLMNFGPINRKGGEKRLNVIFSRAKKHMAVVSSIKHYHITNDYNDGASFFKRFLHYAEMVSTGNMGLARTILDGLVASKDKPRKTSEPTFNTTTSQLKAALEAEGYAADMHVGQSSFKCSLAVKKSAADAQYSLGILVDDDVHYSNADLVEQYYQRLSVLQAFGWKVMPVFAKDWLENREKVMGGLRRALNGVGAVTEVKEETISPVAPVVDDGFTTLVSEAEDKFVAFRLEGPQLVVRTGKRGTKGFVQVRNWETEDKAREEMEREVVQWRGKGYVS